MGQKTHPIGLRVGLWQRKWNNTWYINNNVYKKLFFSHYYIDQLLQNFFTYYNYTKRSKIERALLVNTRFIKTNFNLGFLFVFFYKLRTTTKKKKIKKLKHKGFRKFSNKKFNINKFKNNNRLNKNENLTFNKKKVEIQGKILGNTTKKVETWDKNLNNSTKKVEIPGKNLNNNTKKGEVQDKNLNSSNKKIRRKKYKIKPIIKKELILYNKN